MGLFDFIKRKKPENSPQARRENLLQHGRISDAIIIQTEHNEAGEELAQYSYCIQGVDFESAEVLTEEQCQTPLKYASGADITVRFDPRNHANSIIV